VLYGRQRRILGQAHLLGIVEQRSSLANSLANRASYLRPLGGVAADQTGFAKTPLPL
jgi:hypothetical protein